MKDIIERFIRYVKINTRSDANSNTIPSTYRQVLFQQMLKDELEQLGFDEVRYYEKNSFLIAKIKGNSTKPAIGFIAHVDTADYESENVKPQIIENYDGNIITLNDEYNLDPNSFPNLKNYIGKTLITTSGDTLLGADDKAGIVEIIEACRYFIGNTQDKYGDIYVAFGPDEEIGKGADLFDVNDFPVEFAYTLDGSVLGELQFESFNAAQAEITIKGVSVHPGSAKNKMINANVVATQFHNELPLLESPENTDEKDGFYMLYDIESNVELAKLTYIIRDHDKTIFNHRKNMMFKIADKLNNLYQANIVSVEMIDQYYNMKEIIEKDMRCVELAKKAMLKLGVQPQINAIRGGTDGSKISFMGIPTPNIFTGGENFHGRYEFICVEHMVLATNTIIEIIKENQ